MGGGRGSYITLEVNRVRLKAIETVPKHYTIVDKVIPYYRQNCDTPMYVYWKEMNENCGSQVSFFQCARLQISKGGVIWQYGR